MTESALPTWFSSSVFIAGPITLVDQCTDAVVVGLIDTGVDAITMRSVARRIRCDPSTLHHAFGGQFGFRHAVVERFASRYANWLHGAHPGEIVRLPLHADELHAVRVWSALTELAAGEDRAGRPEAMEAVTAANAAEARFLAWRADVAEADLSPTSIAALLACARGARAAMADPHNPLPRASAAAITEAARSRYIHC